MMNFYREFTKDIARRFNSRALDIRPQEVLNNQVQLVADIERPFIRRIALSLDIPSQNNNPVTQTDWNYYIPIAVLNGTVSTYAGMANPAFFDLERDEISTIEIESLQFYVRVTNTTGGPTSTSHSVSLYLHKSGSSVAARALDVFITTSGNIAAGGNLTIANQTTQNSNTERLDNTQRHLSILNYERVLFAPNAAPSFSDFDNQLTLTVRHLMGSGETVITSFQAEVRVQLKVTYNTPFNAIQTSRVATVQP